MSPPLTTNRRSLMWYCLAWAVHFYTALGLVCASWIAILLLDGDTVSYRIIYLLMTLAVVIDATDGTLARWVDVKHVLPGFDGRRLDDITDYLNYTFLPLLLLYRTDVFPGASSGWLLVPLLASAYGFCQVFVKTEDGYFLGFPSYWNLVAFYVPVLAFPPWLGLATILSLSLLTFIPTRYLYPSQPGLLNRLTTVLGILWGMMLLWVISRLPSTQGVELDSLTYDAALASFLFPVYYLCASWIVTFRVWRVIRQTPSLSMDPSRVSE